MLNSIDSICICGAGTMGRGIALVTALGNHPTILFDTNASALRDARSAIEKDIITLVEKKKLASKRQPLILNNLHYTTDINDCKADLVVEAIVEQLDAKAALFHQLAAINDEQTIFATNTSSLSVSNIATRVKHPERVAGLHFFNPPALMKLVEVVKGIDTSTAVISRLMKLAEDLGKIPVLCEDAPGFIVNRVARPYYLEALKLVELGIADFATIDKVMESLGFRMGPFRLMDLIGNDINYAVTVSIYEACNQPLRFKPSSIQQQKVMNGHLGRKTGRGYYEY
jgi:3-hydroxybutyryl-CoA dehydrogenase